MKIKKAEEKQIALHKKKELEIHTVKNENFTIKNVASISGKAATDQMEGGEELRNAAMMEYMMAKPVVHATSVGASGVKKKFQTDKEKREEQRKNQNKKIRRDEDGTSRNEIKEKKKSSDKSSSKKDDKKSSKKSSDDGKKGKGKKRRLGLLQKAKLILLQNNLANKNHRDGGESQEVPQIVNNVIPWLGLLGIGLLLISAVVVPIMAVIAIIYNSPFAIFMPPLESGDTVMSVTSAYVSEFNTEINDLATNHTGYDMGEIVYIDYEGTGTSASNYYDIIGVYMVKYGVGDTATIINDTVECISADKLLIDI